VNPIFHDLAVVPLASGSRDDFRRVEEREVLELLDMLAAEGVTVRLDALGVLVVEGLRADAPPHVECAVEVLSGRERAVRRVLENRSSPSAPMTADALSSRADERSRPFSSAGNPSSAPTSYRTPATRAES
jgi:hypothetical protein